jgi:hypothetical protein
LWKLHPGSFVADWTTRNVHTRLLARHRLLETDYRLGQLRYDLAKLRAKGMVERLGRSRHYRLTHLGLKLGVLLVKLRLRLLGPLGSLAADPTCSAWRRVFKPSRACAMPAGSRHCSIRASTVRPVACNNPHDSS